MHGTRSLDVDVPAGIDEGQRLRLAQRGPAAPGAVPGDLYVNVRVPRDPDFVRQGDDLLHRTPLSIVQASLGTVLTLETLDGEQELEIHAGTQHGAQLRLRGLGVPSLRNGRRGDLVCEIAVEAPRNLTTEEAELLAQFAALRGEDVQSGARGPVLPYSLRFSRPAGWKRGGARPRMPWPTCSSTPSTTPARSPGPRGITCSGSGGCAVARS